MFTVFDPDRGDEITMYRLSEEGFGAGRFVVSTFTTPRLLGLVNDLQNGLTIELTPQELETISYAGANVAAAETFTVAAFDGELWSAPSTNFVSTGNSPPTVAAIASTTALNTRISLTELFTGEDRESEIQFFRIRDNGRRLVNGVDVSGHFEFNGERLAANVFHQIPGNQISRASYVGSSVKGIESFTIQANDGEFNSAISTSTIASGNSRPEIMQIEGARVAANRKIAATDLFKVVDADGDAGVRYFIADQNPGADSGFWELNGVRQPAAQAFRVEAGELETLFFVGATDGRAADSIYIQVYDGFTFSEPTTFQAITSAKPVIESSGRSVSAGTAAPASDLFNFSDVDGDTAQTYYFVDRSTNADGGHFLLDGVRQQSGRFFRVSAADLNKLTYQAAANSQSEQVGIQVFDGFEFSEITDVTFGSSSPPRVVGTDAMVRPFAFINVAPLVNFIDPDGNNVQRYRILDRFRAGNTGQFELDGNRFPHSTFFEVTPDEFDRLQYRGGTFGPLTEPILIQGFDGEDWSPVSRFNITTVQNEEAPVVVARGINARVGTVVDFQTMFTVSDAGGDAIQTVGFFDTGDFDNSGFFTIDGVRQPARQFVEVDIDLVTAGRVKYQVAGVSSREPYRIFATDGTNRSTLATGVSNAITTPVITASANDISLNTIERRPVTDLINISGAEAARYQVFDANTNSASGRLELDGVALAQGSVLTLTAAEFERLQFVGAVVDQGRQLDPILIRSESSVTGFSEWARVNLNTDQIGSTPTPTPFQFQPSPGQPAGGPLRITYSFIDVSSQTARGTVMNPETPPLPFYYLTGGGNDGAAAQDQAIQTLALNRVQRETVREVLENIESFANIDFVETANVADAQITYGIYAFQGPGSGPRYVEVGPRAIFDNDGVLLKETDLNNGLNEERGDVWFDIQEFDARNAALDVSLGSFFRRAAFQGTLGSLSASINSGLSIFNNFQYNTILSNGNGGLNDPFPAYPESASSLQLYDAVAIQGQYGANASFNTDDNQYRFQEAHQTTIWDAGGRDAINFTTSTVDETIDLRQGQFSSVLGVPQSLRISYGTVIENARGGSGNDTITGNETANFLFGNDGNDNFVGGGGNDVFYGGNGSDIYQWSFGDGRDLIIEQNTLVNTVTQPNLRDNTVDILEIRDPTAALDSLEDDLTFRRFGDNLRIDLTFNQGPGQGTVTIRDYANEDSQVERLRLFDNQGLQISEIDLTSIFDAATSQPQRFQVTGSRLIDADNPAAGSIGIATPV